MKDVLLKIKNKINKLLSDYAVLKEENLLLISEKNKLISEIENCKEKISIMEDKIKIMSITKSVDKDDEQIKSTRLKINEYVREIDKCISLLNE
tara:strand:+ start:481 stop:762 length:282 start_codon:yes stop_codon:yes gene_type:complete